MLPIIFLYSSVRVERRRLMNEKEKSLYFHYLLMPVVKYSALIELEESIKDFQVAVYRSCRDKIKI